MIDRPPLRIDRGRVEALAKLQNTARVFGHRQRSARPREVGSPTTRLPINRRLSRLLAPQATD